MCLCCLVQLKKLHGVVAGLQADIQSLTQRLQAATVAQSQALADQKWWMEARQHLQDGLQVGQGAEGIRASGLRAISVCG